jgi:hypothetical protein
VKLPLDKKIVMKYLITNIIFENNRNKNLLYYKMQRSSAFGKYRLIYNSKI